MTWDAAPLLQSSFVSVTYPVEKDEVVIKIRNLNATVNEVQVCIDGTCAYPVCSCTLNSGMRPSQKCTEVTVQADAFPGGTRELSAAPPLYCYRETPLSACLLLSCVTLDNPQVQLMF